MNLLVFAQIGGFQQIVVDAAQAFVIEFPVRHDGTVDFGFEQGSQHDGSVLVGAVGRGQPA